MPTDRIMWVYILRLEPFAARASKIGWGVYSMAGGHDVMITRPDELAKTIQIAR